MEIQKQASPRENRTKQSLPELSQSKVVLDERVWEQIDNAPFGVKMDFVDVLLEDVRGPCPWAVEASQEPRIFRWVSSAVPYDERKAWVEKAAHRLRIIRDSTALISVLYLFGGAALQGAMQLSPVMEGAFAHVPPWVSLVLAGGLFFAAGAGLFSVFSLSECTIWRLVPKKTPPDGKPVSPGREVIAFWVSYPENVEHLLGLWDGRVSSWLSLAEEVLMKAGPGETPEQLRARMDRMAEVHEIREISNQRKVRGKR